MTRDPSILPPTPSFDAYSADTHRPLIPPADDPLTLFADWMQAARDAELSDANAMTLATVDNAGWPDARIVLLKDVSVAGFTFYTNLGSAKAMQLASNATAALLFHWKSLERQVRLRGRVVPVTSAAADAYFAERARESQIGAWASDQSWPLPERGALEAKVALLRELHKDDDTIPRPPHWSGYTLVPVVMEFWQSQAFRLHDRRQYTWNADAQIWQQQRLNP